MSVIHLPHNRETMEREASLHLRKLSHIYANAHDIPRERFLADFKDYVVHAQQEYKRGSDLCAAINRILGPLSAGGAVGAHLATGNMPLAFAVAAVGGQGLRIFNAYRKKYLSGIEKDQARIFNAEMVWKYHLYKPPVERRLKGFSAG